MKDIIASIFWIFDKVIEQFDWFMFTHDDYLIHPIYYEISERYDWNEIENDLKNGIDRTVVLESGEEITLTTNIR